MKIQWVRTTKMDRKNQVKNKGEEEEKVSPRKGDKTSGDASVVSVGQGDIIKEEEIKFVYAVIPD